MPAVVPLVGAGLSVAAGISAVGAGSMLVGGLMIAGGAMTFVGTLAKDAKLARLGSIASLAGGVVGAMDGTWKAVADRMAEGASASATPLSQTPTAPAPGAAPALAEGGGSAAAATAGSSDLATAAMAESPMQSLYGAEMAPPSNVAISPEGGLLEGNFAPGTGYDPSAGATSAPNAAMAGPAPTAPPSPYALQQGSPAGQGLKLGPTGAPSFAPNITARSGEGFWAGLRGALKDNKELVYLGGGLIAGATQGYMADKQQRDAQRYADQRRADYSASVTGLRAPTFRPAGG